MDTPSELTITANDGFVYIAVCETLNCAKIGWSETREGVDQRIKACSTFCPAEVKLAVAFPGVVADERALHLYFKRQHIRREWFVISDELRRVIRNAGRVGNDPVKRQRWNPARWIPRGATGKTVSKPNVSVDRAGGRTFYVLRFVNPVTRQHIKRTTKETDRDKAMAKAVVVRDEWWDDFCSQLNASKKERRSVVL